MHLLTRTGWTGPPEQGTTSDADACSEEQAGRSAQRGTTAMEYLMMASLILVVVLTAVGYLGNMTGKLSQNNADNISKSMKKGN